jgi:hypothetical protein
MLPYLAFVRVLGGNRSAQRVEALWMTVAAGKSEPPVFHFGVAPLELGVGLARGHAPIFFCAAIAVRNVFQRV